VHHGDPPARPLDAQRRIDEHVPVLAHAAPSSSRSTSLLPNTP
jgi:hypothetical protein